MVEELEGPVTLIWSQHIIYIYLIIILYPIKMNKYFNLKKNQVNKI